MTTERVSLLTKDEVASILSISLRSVDRLVKSGTLQPVKLGRLVRFRPSDVEALIEQWSA